MDIHPDHPELARLAAEGHVVAYFGYGSLVNRNTLRTKFLAIRRASLLGWRRFWLPRRADAAMALLSVQAEEAARIEGVVVYDHLDHLPSVDEREAGYARRILELDRVSIENPPGGNVPLYVYEAHRGTEDAAETGAAILQSYLDAVLQGFLHLYGEEGVRRFVAETNGFETRILADRAAPRYPRAVSLTVREENLFDRLIEERGGQLEPLSGSSSVGG